MTIDEAIKHCEEVAELHGSRCEYYKEHDMNEYIPAPYKCAEEHRQLAEWLKELKMYREMIPSASEVFLAEIRKEKA